MSVNDGAWVGGKDIRWYLVCFLHNIGGISGVVRSSPGPELSQPREGCPAHFRETCDALARAFKQTVVVSLRIVLLHNATERR